MRNRLNVIIGLIALTVALAAAGGSTAGAQGSKAAGSLVVKFFFETPTTVEPTYHTAIWLEDKTGKMVKSLFVSTELSSKEFKMGNICPDWVKQAKWEKVAQPEVDAVTTATPWVGQSELTFDLAPLKLAPGTYGFRFQVHVSEDYNILHKGQFTVGGPGGPITLETLKGPGTLDSTEQFVRDVDVQYVAAK